jgi:hypothetical protein
LFFKKVNKIQQFPLIDHFKAYFGCFSGMRIFTENSGFCYAEHVLCTKKALFEDRALGSRTVISCCERLLFVPVGFGSLSSEPFPLNFPSFPIFTHYNLTLFAF